MVGRAAGRASRRSRTRGAADRSNRAGARRRPTSDIAPAGCRDVAGPPRSTRGEPHPSCPSAAGGGRRLPGQRPARPEASPHRRSIAAAASGGRPTPVRRGLQDQAGEFVGDGEVELARIREISPLQDGVRGWPAADATGADFARHRGRRAAPPRPATRCRPSTSGRTSAAAPTGVAPASPEPGGGPLKPAQGPCGIRPGWRATAGARRPGSCWAEWSKERLRGGDQTKRALDIVILQELAGDAHEKARRIEALVCHRQHAGQRLVEVIARGREVEDEARSPGGEKLQLGEERRVVHRVDELDGKSLIQLGSDRLIVSRRYFDERQQQEAVGRGRRLQFGSRHGAREISSRSRDIARTVEVQESHAHPCRELEGRLSLGGGRSLERAFRQLDRIDIAARRR